MLFYLSIFQAKTSIILTSKRLQKSAKARVIFYYFSSNTCQVNSFKKSEPALWKSLL